MSDSFAQQWAAKNLQQGAPAAAPSPSGEGFAQQWAQQNLGQQEAPPPAAAPRPDQGRPTSLLEDIERGARGAFQGAIVDPVMGAIQGGARLFGQGKAADEWVKQQEAEYQAKRKLLGAGEGDVDVSRFAGGAAMYAVPGIGLAKAGLTGAKAIGSMGALGAAQGALAPVTQGEYGEQKLKDIIVGGGLGALGGAGASSLAPRGVLGRELAEAGEGTLAQQTGNRLFQGAEQFASRVPGQGGLRKQQKAAVDALKQKFDDEYASLYNNAVFRPAPQEANAFFNSIHAKLNNISGFAAPEQSALLRKIGERLHDTMYTSRNPATAQIKPIEGRDIFNTIEQLKNAANKAYRQGDHQFGAALKDLIADFERLGPRGFQDKKAAINRQYKEFLDIKKAVPTKPSGLEQAFYGGTLFPTIAGNLYGAAARNPEALRTAAGAAAPLATEMYEATGRKEGGLAHMAKGKRVKEAFEYGGEQVGKLSDLLKQHYDKYLVPTQADRMRGVGGPSYSAHQLALPEYENIAWGSGQAPTATGLANLARDPRFGGPEGQIFAPLLGSPHMHQSNQIVFDELARHFAKNAPHRLTPDLRAALNKHIQSGARTAGGKQKFNPEEIGIDQRFDIADKAQIQELGKTFDARKNIATYGFGAEGAGARKGQIIPYEEILRNMTDPRVLDAPTFSLGPRAFTLRGEALQGARPDLNAAYPYQNLGTDLRSTYAPVPGELALPDFYAGWRKDVGREAPLKSGALPAPGYYEQTLGYTPKGSEDRVYPRQLITPEYVNQLIEAGYKAGGSVAQMAPGGGVVRRFKQKQNPKLAQALEAYLKGDISEAERIAAVRELMPIRPMTGLPPAYTDDQMIQALDSAKREKFNAPLTIGEIYGNRLDIPAYENRGVFVDTSHKGGKGQPVSYGRTGHLKDVSFESNPSFFWKVGLGTPEQALTPMGRELGEAKKPHAVIKGKHQGTSDEDVRRAIAERMNDPDWVQVGMNPYRHSQFYNKETMNPVWSAEEKLQAGPLVLVPRRGLEETTWEDPRLGLKQFEGKRYKKGGLANA